MRLPIGFIFVVLCLILTAMGKESALVCPATQKESTNQNNKDQSIIIDHETPPIGTGSIIGNHHRIEISGSIEGDKGEGELRLDSSEQNLNEFGDLIPRRVTFTITPVKFKRIDKTDSTGKSREIYLVSMGEGVLERMKMEWSLVTEKNSPMRLVIKERYGQSAIPLTQRVKQ